MRRPGSPRRAAAALLGLVVALLPAGPGGALPRAGGAQLWVARYDAGFSDDARAVAAAPDGSAVYVTGESFSNTSQFDYLTVAYWASDGSVLWARRYTGDPGAGDIPYAIVTSPDGTIVFVTGVSFRNETEGDYTTIAYDAASGSPRWLRRYDGPAHSSDVAHAIGVSPDGATVFVTGVSPGSTSGEDYATVAYRTTTGHRLWVRRYNGPANDNDVASSLAVSPDGSKVIVTGESSGGAIGLDYATIAYDARTSSRLWLMRYDGPAHGDDVASALTMSPNGSSVFVTGHSQGTHSGVDFATLAYDTTTSARLWLSRYDQRRLTDDANAIAVSPDGSKVFVAGDSEAVAQEPDFATVAYQADTGVQSWLYVYGNASVAKSIGVSPDGSRVIVTGVGSSGFDTVAHDAATGLPVWVRGFNPGNHRSAAAAALAIDPDGSKVFVTGWLDGGQTSLDFATVAYEP